VEQKPSIGRVVHFVNYAGQHCAATIAHVWSDTRVNLGYFDPNGTACSAQSVMFASSEINREFSWHWPEYVAPTVTTVETPSEGGAA